MHYEFLLFVLDNECHCHTQNSFAKQEFEKEMNQTKVSWNEVESNAKYKQHFFPLVFNSH